MIKFTLETMTIWRRALGVSKEQAAENRRAIVAAATKLFRERGVDAVGLTELMKLAGFTQGGFYNHFESKAALVAEVMASAMSAGYAKISKNASASAGEPTTALGRYIDDYVSQDHRDYVDRPGCPVAGFAGDATRFNSGAQSHFARGLDDQITILAGLIAQSGWAPAAGESKTLREKAISMHCEMVGALVLSRSIARAAPAFSDEILASVHRDVVASTGHLTDKISRPRKKSKTRTADSGMVRRSRRERRA